MCNRYVSPSVEDIEREWRLTRPAHWEGGFVAKNGRGAFLRPSAPGVGDGFDLVVGRWGLIPHFADGPNPKYATNNARGEELARKASFRDPWKRGQRCIIPAWSFDEPCWESGHNVWWRFTRRDVRPWGLAGLWNTWTDRHTGEVHESYTMLTINADTHPIMSRMHKPDPKLGPDQQDKRSVVVIEPEDTEAWFTGSLGEVQQLLKSPREDVLQWATL